MQESKNFILAIVLSAVVLIVWSVFFAEPVEDQPKDVKQLDVNLGDDVSTDGSIKIDSDEISSLSQNSVQNIQSNSESYKFVQPQIKNILPRTQILLETSAHRIPVNSDKLHGSVNLKGLRFDDITLAKFRQKLDENSPEVILLSPSRTAESYFIDIGWIGKNTKLPNKETLWQTNAKQISPNQPVELFWDNGEGVLFKTILTLDEDYLFSVEQLVENKSGKDLLLFPYALINRSKEDFQTFFISHEGPIGVFDEVLSEYKYKKIKKEKVEQKNVRGWLGIADKYWLTAIVPDSQTIFNAGVSHYPRNNQNRYQVDYRGGAVSLNNNSTISVKNKIFIGAKNVPILDRYSEEFDIPLFDRAVDFGWLYFITKPMFYALNFLQKFLGNFGLAIVFFTVLVKLALYPLASKGFRSMARMRALMPEMKKMRERCGDDKMKLNQEMMAFYRKKRINPAAGCFPILLQVPIFFALYKVLFITIEMRHAPFYLWIKDLSVPDPTSVFNLFGLLPFTPPEFLPMIGVLPIIFCVSMIIQQKMHVTPIADPTQKMIMRWLPFIFLFIFAGFPAGLVLYWSWSNILSILQQYFINKKIRHDEFNK